MEKVKIPVLVDLDTKNKILYVQDKTFISGTEDFFFTTKTMAFLLKAGKAEGFEIIKLLNVIEADESLDDEGEKPKVRRLGYDHELERSKALVIALSQEANEFREYLQRCKDERYDSMIEEAQLDEPKTLRRGR